MCKCGRSPREDGRCVGFHSIEESRWLTEKTELTNRYNKVLLLKEEVNKTEHCIVCGADTSIPKSYSIELRNFYVEGAGQLCGNCWDKVY